MLELEIMKNKNYTRKSWFKYEAILRQGMVLATDKMTLDPRKGNLILAHDLALQ